MFGKQNERTAKNEFVKKCSEPLGAIYEQLHSLPELDVSSLAAEKAALIIVDMINGFVKEGALASPNALAINGTIAGLAALCKANGMSIAALADSHGEESPEFSAFPIHCMSGTAESQITDEILASCDAVRIEKNSTNGFLEPAFKEWLESLDTTTFVITGVCTDLCVLQLACTLKSWFNSINRPSRVIVPVDCAATYDGGSHDSTLVGTMALYIMQTSGIELCSKITG
ncbi:MAG: cysteine hydrolase [Ruminococcaceae bacterium]|nr:cysteine hydrolase [Oscillospiraceae bacterium]